MDCVLTAAQASSSAQSRSVTLWSFTNYGHGGAGITLSWGTAKLAVDLGAPGHNGAVAVLGPSVVGLSTARLLQDSGFEVTIYAKDLPPNTTSNVAGGFWYPVTLFEEQFRTAAFNDQFAQACNFAFTRFQMMVGSRYGVRWTSSFRLGHSAFSDTGDFSRHGLVGSLTPEFRDLATGQHPFAGYEFVRAFDTMLIEPPIYLTALMQDFLMAGGRRAGKPVRENASPMTEGFVRTGACGSSSSARREFSI